MPRLRRFLELISGGQVPTPGDVSRAHYSVRYLDELPECRRHVLEALPQPQILPSNASVFESLA